MTGTHTNHPSFEPVVELFDRYLQEEGFSGQLSIRFRGELVVDLAGGSLAPESLTGVYSVSKGVAALVIARLIDTGELDLDALVTHYWPEFGTHGKGVLTVRQLLSHQAGLPAILGARLLQDMLDSAVGAAALAAQRPLWQPGSAFGYHAVTIGVFMEELVRRIRGTTLQQTFNSEIRGPRQAEFYLGLPASLDERYVDVADAVLTSDQRRAAAAAPPRDALAEAVFGNFDAPTTEVRPV